MRHFHSMRFSQGSRLVPPAVFSIAFAIAITIGSSPVTAQSTGTAPGAIRSYSTISSIGVEWDISGDADHDATAAVQYRQAGTTAWKTALPLVRVDYNANMLAGSVLFLSPATSYEVRLSLSDPDGGGSTQTVTVATRPVPAPPSSGRTFHVVPGSGGGDGSSGNPFRGIGAADAAAQPGDTFLVHGGSYGGRISFTHGGTANAYIAWKGAGDGEALFAGIDVYGSYVWLEGLTIRDQPFALMSKDAPTGVVVTRCAFYNNNYSVYLQRGGRYWYIVDNVIVGDAPYWTESFEGEGVELNGYAVESYGHTVANNSISNVADGISNGTYNIDVYGNDIFDTSDDGFEGDPGGPNIRVWGNRIHNAAHNGISYQPQNGSPWYIIRNQLAGFMESPFKFRTTDRSVIAHNTIVMWDKMICCNDAHLLQSIVKNNLWISVAGGQIWDFGSSAKDWRTDFSNDGFDWGANGFPFRYGGTVYTSLSALAAAGLEANARRIDRNACFTSLDIPGPAPVSIPAQMMTLRSGCNAIDAGVILPNINDGYSGSAPDMGAYELGQPQPTYGPRPATNSVVPIAPTGLRIVS
ncbi:MAG TPA: right-handed parallel beta-helix repeat-containing protein [Vicinamibacterales bacterium]|nr:right-handed parallel beta-helix repeat-containing protein [Vicinamibacterales bacterium]